MSIIRKNPITHDWVIFAPNRASRPQELKPKEEDRIQILEALPPYREDCPFCRGNEGTSNTEIWRIPISPQWQVRVIENKYSSVDRNVEPQKNREGLRMEMQGFGIHDVIIDHPLHNKTLALMTNEDLLTLILAWRTRFREIQENPKVRHVVIFKNQGLKAGGSLEHPHSQIYGLPVIPFETQIRLREMERYYDINDQCLVCDLTADELEQKKRIIVKNQDFVALAPYADLSPYHFWIIPLKHQPSFSLLSEDQAKALAEVLGDVFRRVFKVLQNPDYNLVIQSLAHFEREQAYFHWYISVIPQVKHKGGLEYAGGLYVNPVLPETAAEELRKAF